MWLLTAKTRIDINLMKKLQKPVFLQAGTLFVFLCGFLPACSQTPVQYKSSPPSLPVFAPPERGAEFFSQATSASGGLLLNRRPQLTEEQKDQKTRQNSLRPIDYGTGAAGGINMKTTHQEAGRILNFKFLVSGNVSVYKEGIAVVWRDDPPQIPVVIFLGTSYQGTLDFGPPTGKQKVGSSFVDQFTTGIQDATKDPRAKNFILSTYRYMEQTKEDCLQTRKCSIQISPSGDSILFYLPRMVLSFGNDERKTLSQIVLIDNSHEPGCFNRPFDFLTTSFLCDSRQSVSLGEPYGKVVEKAGILRDLPIIYTNSSLVQWTRSTDLIWNRTNLDEEESSVPEETPLAGVVMGRDYTAPFLMGGRRVQVKIKGKDVFLSLEEPSASPGGEDASLPFAGGENPAAGNENPSSAGGKPPSDEESSPAGSPSSAPGAKPSLSGEADSPSTGARPSDASGVQSPPARGKVPPAGGETPLLSGALPPLYLSTALPVLAGQGALQKNFVKAFLNLLEGQYLSFHQQDSSMGEPETFKRVYGEYSDRHAVKLAGQLMVPGDDGSFVEFIVTLDGASGQVGVQVSLAYNDFSRHIFKNQKPFDLSRPVKEVHGFRLGDRLYLRNKDLGAGTAVVAYETEGGTLLKALMDYSSELENSVVYGGGRDLSVTYQNQEMVSLNSMTFGIVPTFKTREQDGHSFEEYEIISLYTNVFFYELQNLCSLEDLNLQVGMYDREFEQSLVEKVAHYRQAFASQIPFGQDICPYISPEDPLSASLKRVYYFPNHSMVLGFSDREFSSFRVYQKPGVVSQKTPSPSGQSQGVQE